MSDFKERLKKLGACNEAQKWASQFETPEEAWEACDRGDWMMWIYAESQNYDKRKDILCRGYHAQLVIHLMKDERSIDAVYAAINYGNYHIGDLQLDYSANAANAAYAANAANAAANSAAYAAANAAAANAANAANAAAYAAERISVLKQCADICRKHLPIPII